MTTITVQAVYRGGALYPQAKLDLPEDTQVEVQVTPTPSRSTTAASLFGKFPELASLTGDDFAWAKRLWDHGLEKQSRLLDGLA